MSKPKLIQLIHVAVSQLKLDEDTYRQMLLSITGSQSTREMDVQQLTRVLEALKRKGFRVKPSKRVKTTLPLDDSLQSKKIRALWLEMASAGIVRDSSEQALTQWVKRETGIDGLRWLNTDQASKVIEKLKQWYKRITRKNL